MQAGSSPSFSCLEVVVGENGAISCVLHQQQTDSDNKNVELLLAQQLTESLSIPKVMSYFDSSHQNIPSNMSTSSSGSNSITSVRRKRDDDDDDGTDNNTGTGESGENENVKRMRF